MTRRFLSGWFETERKPRLPVAIGAACALYVAWFYAETGPSLSLFYAAGVSALAATVLPRPLRFTTRSIVWGWVLLLVILLAANIDRVIPGRANEPGYLFFYDRLVTGGFAVSMAALFFRPSRRWSALVVGGLAPMLILAMSRRFYISAISGPKLLTPVWIAVTLAIVFFHIVDATERFNDGSQRHDGNSLLPRVLATAILLGIALAIFKPVNYAIEKSLSAGLELLNRPFGMGWSRGSGSRLGLASPPIGFGEDVRPLLVIRAGRMPGYLRESVYTRYDNGSWIREEEDKLVPTEKLAPRHSADDVMLWFPFAAATNSGPALALWDVQILRPWQVPGICLPGGAREIGVDDNGDPSFSLRADGIVTSDSDRSPQLYTIGIAAGGGLEAWPYGTPGTNDLAIPSALLPAVSNWNARCGLQPGLPADKAAAKAIAYFNERFTYKLGLDYRHGVKHDPLEFFMENRKGHCTLFASATALMLRQCGIPTRVVSGFYCSEQHPWTGEWMVRGRDGHAWCEAYDNGARRWILVDTTPSAGLPSYGKTGMLRIAWETASFSWRRFQQAITRHNPLVWVAMGGEWVIVEIWTFVTSGWSVPAWMLSLWLLIRWCRHMARRNVSPYHELLKKMQRFERSVSKRESRRKANETWSEWAERISPALPAEQAALVLRTVREYEHQRYTLCRASVDKARPRREDSAGHRS
jgi:transglutaminase-like putative cysteine protease